MDNSETKPWSDEKKRHILYAVEIAKAYAASGAGLDQVELVLDGSYKALCLLPNNEKGNVQESLELAVEVAKACALAGKEHPPTVLATIFRKIRELGKTERPI